MMNSLFKTYVGRGVGEGVGMGETKYRREPIWFPPLFMSYVHEGLNPYILFMNESLILLNFADITDNNSMRNLTSLG